MIQIIHYWKKKKKKPEELVLTCISCSSQFYTYSELLIRHLISVETSKFTKFACVLN